MLALVFTLFAWAEKAVVIVHEAPLMAHEGSEAPILEYKRLGDKIEIHSGDAQKQDLLSFYRLFTRDGRLAYIDKKYVKIIFGDHREEGSPIRPIDRDPTDYRKAEPISNFYPFSEEKNDYSGVVLDIGPSLKFRYTYSKTSHSEAYGARKGLTLFYFRPGPPNTSQLGFWGGYTLQEREIKFTDNSKANESLSDWRFGPAMSYRFFQDKYMDFGLLAGVMGHYLSASIDTGTDEDRSFRGFGVSGKFLITYSRKRLFPRSGLELIGGLGAELPLYSNLKGGKRPSSGPWNAENDVISSAIQPQLTLSIGLQQNY